MEAGRDLGKVVGARLVGFAQRGVDVFLAGDDDPRTALALCAQLLGDGLQVEHELGVPANELPHLVHQKDDPVRWSFGLQILVDQRRKTFDVDAVTFAGVVEPLASGIFAHAERLAQAGNDVIAQEINRVAFGLPVVAIGDLECLFETIKAAFADEISLHFCNVRRIS